MQGACTRPSLSLAQGREPAARKSPDAAQLRAGGAGCPRPSACRTVDDAEQRSDRQLDPRLEPWFELFPGPVVHADLTAPAPPAAPPPPRAPAPPPPPPRAGGGGGGGGGRGGGGPPQSPGAPPPTPNPHPPPP